MIQKKTATLHPESSHLKRKTRIVIRFFALKGIFAIPINSREGIFADCRFPKITFNADQNGNPVSTSTASWHLTVIQRGGHDFCVWITQVLGNWIKRESSFRDGVIGKRVTLASGGSYFSLVTILCWLVWMSGWMRWGRGRLQSIAWFCSLL